MRSSRTRSSSSRLDTRWFVKGERKAPGGEDGSDVASLKAEIDRLTRTNAALETENGQLKTEIETAKGKSTVAPKPSPAAPAATPTWRATPKSARS